MRLKPRSKVDAARMGVVVEFDTDHLDFLADLENVINKHSKENDSNTPDFMLAALLSDFLKLWGSYCSYRDGWYQVVLEPGNSHFKDPDLIDEQIELYALYKRAQQGNCRCSVCVRLRAKAWDDQNNLVPGEVQ